MSKIISKKTKSSEKKVIKILNSQTLLISTSGIKAQLMTAAEALTLGRELIAQRKFPCARAVADQLYESVPNVIDVGLLRLNVLVLMENLFEALELSKNLLLLAPSNLGVLKNTAHLYMILGDSSKAIEFLNKALKLSPDNSTLMTELGACYKQIGDSDHSMQMYGRALASASLIKNPLRKEIKILQALTGIGGYRRFKASEADFVLNAIKNVRFDKGFRSSMAFSLASNARREKNQALEIKYLHAANNIMLIEDVASNPIKWSPDEVQQKFEKSKALFDVGSPDWLEGYSGASQDVPIFILAMPRSGTTLQEQILGSHSLVGQTGESRALSIAIGRTFVEAGYQKNIAAYPDELSKLGHQQLDKIADYYVRHQRLYTDRSYFVDKQLSTYEYVGLIANLFPNAKFIHMNREPLDIFLSCYQGNIPGIPATYSVANLARQYIVMKKYIGHWKRVFPGRVHVIDYSSLVEDPELVMREAFQYLGLDWEPQVLDFHKRKNVVRTLSVNQVRQGIYKSAVKKWLPYKDMLDPALTILEENGISSEGCRYL